MAVQSATGAPRASLDSSATASPGIFSALFNQSPVMNPTLGGQNLYGQVSGDLDAVDPDSSTLTYAVTQAPAHGAVALASDGSYSYTPDQQFASTGTTDSFKVSVSDDASGFHIHGLMGLLNLLTFGLIGASGHEATAVVTLNVMPFRPANSAPTGDVTVGTPDVSTGVVTGTVTGSDADGDPLSYSATAMPVNGTLDLAIDGSFTYSPTSVARQAASAVGAAASAMTDTFTVTIADGYGGTTNVDVAVPISPLAPRVTFNFVYESGSQYWSADARNALNAVAQWLSSSIVVTTPVTLTYSILGEDTVKSGQLAASLAVFSSSDSGVYATVAQNKVLTGVDANGSAADAQISWNFAYPWALGEQVGSTQYDFTAAAIHEILHTLGIFSGIEGPSNMDQNWTTYDSFVVTSGGKHVVGSDVGNDYVWDTAYTSNLTGGSGGLYFGGPNAVAAYGGLVPLYTPSTWAPGSSVSHLSSTNPNAGAQVMTALAHYGLGARVLSPVEWGILKDLGYTVTPQPSLFAFIVVGFGLVRRRRRN